MLGWPESTTIKQPLAKKLVYDSFQLSAAAKARFEKDIRRMALVAELSPSTVAIPAGEEVQAIYLLQVSLRQATYSDKNLELLAKLIDQRLLFLLEHENKAQLAVFRGRLLKGAWQPMDGLRLPLQGLDLDALWQGFVARVGGIAVQEGHSLDEQIEVDAKREGLLKEIAQLEKKAWSEKQPRKRFELVQEIKMLKIEMKESMP